VHVSQFYADGMVSAAVNEHYGSEPAVQLEYAPYGRPTGLCTAVATTAHQNEGLSLQPCSTPGTTVWILDTADSPGTASFPIVNGSDTDPGADPFSSTTAMRGARLWFHERNCSCPSRARHSPRKAHRHISPAATASASWPLTTSRSGWQAWPTMSPWKARR